MTQFNQKKQNQPYSSGQVGKMFTRISIFVSLSAMLLSPVAGQFGIAGKRKSQGGSSFQELNEQAKKIGDVGGVGDMDELMKKMVGDNGMMKDLENLGPQLDEVMKMMADLSPEELAKQMENAMDMFTGDDMMSNMLGHSDEILKTLEDSGAVDAEELDKFKKDPEYFEQKMKESLDQMKELFADPSMLETAKQGMEAAQNMYKNPGAVNEMMESLLKDLSDEDIESVRQMVLENGGGDPMIQQLLGSMDKTDLDDALKDPVTWRNTVKGGLGLPNQQQGKVGAGVGEL